MENWQRNLEVIARSKGSPQARDEGCQDNSGRCEICFGELDEYAQYGVCSGCRETGKEDTMNAYKITTEFNYSQLHLVIANSLGEAEKIWGEEYPDAKIKSIELMTEYVLTKED